MWRCLLFNCLLSLCIAVNVHAWEEPSTPSADDMRFGILQVEQILVDRPDLVDCLRQRPQLKAWLAESFAGSRHGGRIYWDMSNPSGGSNGEYLPGRAGRPTTISVTDKKELSGYDRLAVLIFEVCNSESASIVIDIVDGALAGDLNREQFAKRIIETEYHASMKCKSHLIRHSIPFDRHPQVASLLCLPNDSCGFWSDERNGPVVAHYNRYFDRMHEFKAAKAAGK